MLDVKFMGSYFDCLEYVTGHTGPTFLMVGEELRRCSVCSRLFLVAEEAERHSPVMDCSMSKLNLPKGLSFA